MKTKIDARELKIGMYVCELDRPWRETPFLFQGFEIRTADEIKTVQQYCQQVYIIEPESGVTPSSVRPKPTPSLPSKPVVETVPKQAFLEQQLLKINNHPGAQSVYVDQTTLEEETKLVESTFLEAQDLVRDMMWEAKLGRSLNVPGARKLITKLVQSALRNPDALTCFTHLKQKDEYTAQHSLRVAILSLVFGRQLGLTDEELEQLGLGALLLDLGKMKIPSEILNKPAPLLADDMNLARQHVPWGIEIIEKTQHLPATVMEIIRRHHERFDGSGYLDKLKGDAIGLAGLIAGMVDYYDAVTSDRVYRAGISSHVALKKMYEWRGTQFHPELVEKFIQCLGIYPIGSVVELNTGEIGVVVALNRSHRLRPRVILVQRADKTFYPQMPAVSLAGRKTAAGRPCEIERVLEPEACGIDPARYLPLPLIG